MQGNILALSLSPPSPVQGNFSAKKFQCNFIRVEFLSVFGAVWRRWTRGAADILLESLSLEKKKICRRIYDKECCSPSQKARWPNPMQLGLFRGWKHSFAAAGPRQGVFTGGHFRFRKKSNLNRSGWKKVSHKKEQSLRAHQSTCQVPLSYFVALWQTDVFISDVLLQEYGVQNPFGFLSLPIYVSKTFRFGDGFDAKIGTARVIGKMNRSDTWHF